MVKGSVLLTSVGPVLVQVRLYVRADWRVQEGEGCVFTMDGVVPRRESLDGFYKI